jgi:hypothetical protein
MATRAIVTDQPEVACDICGRRLLRGERPDRFLAHGETHSVCELCVPRAVSSGWVRTADDSQAGPDAGGRRRRSNALLGLVRRRRDETDEGLLAAQPGASERATGSGSAHASFLGEAFGEFGEGEAANGAQRGDWTESASPVETSAGMHAELDELVGGVATDDDPAIAVAIDVFNNTDQPRRIAGVSRSFGPPWVTVRRSDRSHSDEVAGHAAAAHGTRMTVVAAWELCWYRWEIDLDDDSSPVVLIDRGTELEELAPADLLANAAADDDGRLARVAADTAAR